MKTLDRLGMAMGACLLLASAGAYGAEMDKKAFVQFLVDAKQNTYASQGDSASLKPLLPDTRQLEYRKGSSSIATSTRAKKPSWVKRSSISRTSLCGR
jgi:hypothetical protein